MLKLNTMLIYQLINRSLSLSKKTTTNLYRLSNKQLYRTNIYTFHSSKNIANEQSDFILPNLSNQQRLYLKANKKHIHSLMNSFQNMSTKDLQIQRLRILESFKSETLAKNYFKNIQKDISGLYAYIKQNILVQQDFPISKYSHFYKTAHYYFQKQGKKIRPIMIKLLAETIINSKVNLSQQKKMQIDDKIQLWSSLIQIMHIASLAHDDVIDNSPSRRGQQSQHILYGKSTAIFSGNYIISKASRQIYKFRDPYLFQIYSMAMDELAYGQVIQLVSKNYIGNKNSMIQYSSKSISSLIWQKIKDKLSFSNKITSKIVEQKQLISAVQLYMDKSYFKTAALMSNALRALPSLLKNLSQIGDLHQLEQTCFRIGQHFGLAFQIVDDILDYISTMQEMGKEAMKDLYEGNVTAPVYLTLWRQYRTMQKDGNILKLDQISEKICSIAMKKHKTKQELNLVKSWVTQHGGIQMALILAWNHIETGLQYVKAISGQQQNELYQVWVHLGQKILNRRK